MTNHRIWPGPEDIRGRAHRLEKLAAEHGPFGALTRLGFLERAERAEFDRRSLGIAMGHVRARARMRRFVAWLEESEEAGAFDDVLAHVSPEAAVHYAASKGYQWPFYTTGGDWLDRWWDAFGRTAEMALVPEMLASPEWAFLPWQRDPEVRRGT